MVEINMVQGTKDQDKDKITWGLGMKRATTHFTWEYRKNTIIEDTSKLTLVFLNKVKLTGNSYLYILYIDKKTFSLFLFINVLLLEPS